MSANKEAVPLDERAVFLVWFAEKDATVALLYSSILSLSQSGREGGREVTAAF